MHGFVKVAAVGIAAVAPLASCGGGQADTAAPTGSTFDVTASAGELQATLSLAPDSLPEGTAPRDVGLEMLVDENAESGAPTVALLLLPDRLILDEAATLTVGLPDALLNSAFMVIHVSGDSVEFLEGELVAVDGDVFFRIPITHFSLVDLTRIFGVIGSSLSVAPERVSVGQTHEALATIRLSTEPIEVFLSFRSEDGNFRRFRFSAPQAPLVWGSARTQEWKHRRWSPDQSPVEVTRTASGWETSSHVAACLEPDGPGRSGLSSVGFQTTLRANVTLLNRGEPEPRNFIGFSQLFLAEEGPTLGDDSVERNVAAATVDLLDLAEGDTVAVLLWVSTWHESTCEAASGSTTEATITSSTDGVGSSTVTTGLPSPPVSKIGEASDESGDAGDVRYDIRNLNHEEQDGSHSLSLQLGRGLVVGDGGG